MFAEVSCIEKLPLFWAIIPVYFVVVEVTLSMNYYIILDSRVSTFFRLVSLIFFEPLAFMTVLTHLISMFTSPGYVPDPFKPRYISNKLPQSNKNLERKERDDLYCKKCRNPRPPRAHHCKICRKCTLKMLIVLDIIIKKIFINFYFMLQQETSSVAFFYLCVYLIAILI